jgi:membrane-associated PAP2 superfamily phosphatase
MHVTTNRLAQVSCAALLAILLWDASGLDLTLAQAVGGANGFPLRDNWLLNAVTHTGAKYSAWLLEVFICAAVIFPLGPFGRLPLSRRIQIATTVILASGLVSLLKANSLTSCPWDLHEFGGVARHLSHWSGWLNSDGGAGRCFPAGHASAGFAFLGGYFAFRHDAPSVARLWLVGALVAGLAFGISQQLRGAHFMSHTLWTGWICWMTAFLTDPLFIPVVLPQAQESLL